MKTITISLIAILLLATVVIATEEIDFKKLYIDSMSEVAYWRTTSNYWQEKAEYYRTHRHCGNNNAQTIVFREKETVIENGDLNQDGVINQEDKSIMNDCLNGLGNCDGCDLNNDGVVDTSDKSMLNNILNGL